MSQRVAIIGGSKEAIVIAAMLQENGIEYLLFDTKKYASPDPITSRRYTRDTDWQAALTGFDLAIIAPHPFAFDRVLIPKSVTIPQAAFCRPKWQTKPNWTLVPDTQTAADTLVKIGAKRPLVAIGRERLAPLLDTRIRDMQVRCKSEPLPDFNGKATPVLMRGPFTVAEEIKYMQTNAIDCVVAHNAGGEGGLPKLDAADQLNLPVILIDRAEIAWDQSFDTMTDLTGWLRTQGLDLPAKRP